jgi:geranylgeranyl pyrophosphate synthase
MSTEVDIDIDAVVEYAKRFAREAAPTPELAATLDTAFTGLATHAGRYQRVFFVDVPVHVYAAVRGETAPAMPLASAIALLFLGLDTADDVTDGDLPSYWQACSLADIQIVTIALLASLPQQIVARLDAPAETRAGMQEAIARTTLKMIAGQQRDVQAAGSANVRAAAVEAMVAAKSGEEVALFASLAARFAGADAAQIAHYEEMGRALGTAAQLTSDCDDLFVNPHSKDLAAGTRTLPIALGLERITGPARDEFVSLLERARTDAAAGIEVRTRLRDAGVLAPCTLYIEIYRQRGLAALEAAGAREPARSRLRRLIDMARWPRPQVGRPTLG